MIDQLKCSRCFVTKPVSCFHKRSSGNKTGYASHCRSCDAQRNKAYRAKNISRNSSRKRPTKRKRCPGCLEVKVPSAFNRDNGRTDRTATYCRDCSRSRLLAKSPDSSIDNSLREPENRETTRKICKVCGIEKTGLEFNLSRSTSDLLSRKCKECSRLATSLWRSKNKSRVREYGKNYALKDLYGITIDDYNAMYEKQGGVCAVCKSSELSANRRYFCVDHCHKTGKVRGLLCSLCNAALGCARDDTNILRSLISYIECALGVGAITT